VHASLHKAALAPINAAAAAAAAAIVAAAGGGLLGSLGGFGSFIFKPPGVHMGTVPMGPVGQPVCASHN
jgi:hypothetical protein